MTVEVTELRSEDTRRWGPNEGARTRGLIIQLDSTDDDTSKEAYDNCGVLPNDSHPEEPGFYASEFDVSPVGGENVRRRWQVRVTYKIPQPGERFGDPVNDPAVIRFSGRSQQVIAVKDKDGKAVLNSAKDWFAPPAEIEIHPMTISIERNEAALVPATMLQYRDSVNSAGITVAGLTLAVRQGLLTQWDASTFQRHGYSRYAHSYTIEVAVGNWDLVLLDQGLFYIDSGNKKNRILVRGEPAEEAQRLDGSGGVLDPDAGPEDSEFLNFRVRKEVAWSTLNLPTSV